MATSPEQKIREAVLQYIAGRIQLGQFQEWFAKNTWDVRAESNDVQQLVNEIDLLLAEFSNGHWTEGELRTRLQQYRSVVQPFQDVGEVLWSEVRAPYAYTPTSAAQKGYEQTTYPPATSPIPTPQIEPTSVAV